LLLIPTSNTLNEGRGINHAEISAAGNAVVRSQRTTSIRSASTKAANFTALSKLPTSSKDFGIPKRLPYQTRQTALRTIAVTSVPSAQRREKGAHEMRRDVSRLSSESLVGEIQQEKLIMNTATLVKWVRDPRSGEVHLPSEEVTIMGVIRNMDRTLMKVRWNAGGDCVVFPEELAEMRQG
jgi:hypothetical protein